MKKNKDPVTLNPCCLLELDASRKTILIDLSKDVLNEKRGESLRRCNKTVAASSIYQTRKKRINTHFKAFFHQTSFISLFFPQFSFLHIFINLSTPLPEKERIFDIVLGPRHVAPSHGDDSAASCSAESWLVLYRSSWKAWRRYLGGCGKGFPCWGWLAGLWESAFIQR